MLYKASAPGSLMLLGEYAVLENERALVAAIDQRISVCLKPRTDEEIHISSALGEYQTTLKKLTVEQPFTFVLATLKHYQRYLKTGCEITITADFSNQIGFASSAAVTVATLSALTAWLNRKLTLINLVGEARQIIQSVQGVGSGADAAACVYGGVVIYQRQPIAIEKLAITPALTVVYSGSKTPTVDAIAQVKEKFAALPLLYKQVMHTMGLCVNQALRAVRREDWPELGKLMNVNQGLLDAIGVTTPVLHKIIDALRANDNLYGVKISGSGLGDCIVALGHSENKIKLPASPKGIKHIPVQVTLEGMRYE